MAIDFPSSPSINQLYTYLGQTWEWNGTGWRSVSDDTIPLSSLDIDGGTDIGAAIADADLFIVDDGGAGNNRKAAATRITDYVFGKTSGDVTIASNGTASIATGAIVNADISASAGIAYSKLASLTSANILVGNASNVATATAVTGDVTISNAGVTAIASGVIVDADISAAAEIAVSKLADGAARQLLQTDAAGTGVEWTSNVDIPGTLDVTNAATFDSTISFPLGTAALPSIYPGTDTNTGIWSPAADTLAMSTAGVERIRIDSNGNIRIAGATNANASNSIVRFNDYSDNGPHGYIEVGGYGASNYGGEIGFEKARGTSSSPTIVSDGDALGIISFLGYDGTTGRLAARISGGVDGTPGSGDMPGRLVFATTADGASVPTERMRVTNDGYLRMAASAGGIQFNGDTAAANALDDYEEGTFVPTLIGVTTAGTGTYTTQEGNYRKMGKLVFASIYLQWTAHTGAGSMRINGLPFACPNLTAVAIWYNNVTMNAGNFMLGYADSTQVMINQSPTGGGAAQNISMDTAGQVMASCVYATSA